VFSCCREVWPEREEFGSADISPEDEFMALREICFANIPSKSCLFTPLTPTVNFTDS